MADNNVVIDTPTLIRLAKTWNRLAKEGKTVDDVAHEMRMEKKQVQSLASRIKTMGGKLEKFPKKRKSLYDWAAIVQASKEEVSGKAWA